MQPEALVKKKLQSLNCRIIDYHFINTTEEKPLMQAGLSMFENKCTRHQNAYVRIM